MRDSSFSVRKDIFAHPDILFLANDGRDISLHELPMIQRGCVDACEVTRVLDESANWLGPLGQSERSGLYRLGLTG
ncbi:hypothetical protein P368_21910 [Comamonas thiooxydans]|nr:hypothetical protein P365_21245 [Comamonas thiooxydans]KGH06196.1 hypothetical protein P368_21910 [Comamonas thiooxydans]